jgi:hypothetical protein
MNKPNHLTLKQAFKHLCVREYMTGVARTKDRVKATGEVFTPDALVKRLFDDVLRADPKMFAKLTHNLLDPSCGDGQILAWQVIYKLTKGNLKLLSTRGAETKNIYSRFIIALNHIHGVDIMPDNIKLCHQRLSCGFDNDEINQILKRNVRCEDALKYDGSFE